MMNNPKTIAQSLIKLLEDEEVATFGTDLFYGKVPDSKKVPEEIYWVEPLVTSTRAHNVTGEDTLRCPFLIYFRSTSVQSVDEHMFELTKLFTSLHCTDLDGFTTVDIALRTGTQSLFFDNENRAVSSVIVTLTVYNINK